jgi:hypothetical protein
MEQNGLFLTGHSVNTFLETGVNRREVNPFELFRVVRVKKIESFQVCLIRSWALNSFLNKEVAIIHPTPATFDAGIDNFVVALGLGGESGAEQDACENKKADA